MTVTEGGGSALVVSIFHTPSLHWVLRIRSTYMRVSLFPINHQRKESTHKHQSTIINNIIQYKRKQQ